jgi:hypothetical protein
VKERRLAVGTWPVEQQRGPAGGAWCWRQAQTGRASGERS